MLVDSAFFTVMAVGSGVAAVSPFVQTSSNTASYKTKSIGGEREYSYRENTKSEEIRGNSFDAIHRMINDQQNKLAPIKFIGTTHIYVPATQKMPEKFKNLYQITQYTRNNPILKQNFSSSIDYKKIVIYK